MTSFVLILLTCCSARPAAMSVSPDQSFVVHGAVRLADGNRNEGRVLFTKMRCDTCHSVAGRPGRAPHPLPDLTAEPPEAVAAMIVERTELAPGALFDEMAMSSAASRLTPQELAHLVAYLRSPSDER